MVGRTIAVVDAGDEGDSSAVSKVGAAPCPAAPPLLHTPRPPALVLIATGEHRRRRAEMSAGRVHVSSAGEAPPHEDEPGERSLPKGQFDCHLHWRSLLMGRLFCFSAVQVQAAPIIGSYYP